MFAYVKGILAQSSPLHAIVEVNGIGYHISIPASLYPKLPQIGEPIQLHTSFVIREFSQALYGFLSPNEKELFEILIDLSGVGPKTALNLIGHLPLPTLQQAVLGHDIHTLSKVPGIGKKTAERLIIELKDKLANLLPPDPSMHAVHLQSDPRSMAIKDAMSALINLGYNQVVAQKAIKKCLNDYPDHVDLASLITNALKHI
jgi:holliday junction DNA helicase RuvA